MLCLKLIDKKGNTVEVARGEKEVNLCAVREYQEGDVIALEASGLPGFVWLQLDDALGQSLVYVTGEYYYHIPFGEKRVNLSPKVFSGDVHLLKVKRAEEFEIQAYRNLALNVNDCHENEVCYPHASANVETRGEAVFAAKNAIDGVTANSSHGKWPYASWGINRNPDACLKLDFGREIETDKIVLYLRADFPHDNWWKQMRITFSNGDVLEVNPAKTGEGQVFPFEKKRISWLTLSHLIPSGEPSPFPALTQIEVYGTEAESNRKEE